jgi:hypothetical protein
MLGRWFGGRKSGAEERLFEPRMPDVDVLPSIEEVFAKARQEAATDEEPPSAPTGRRVVVVTLGRMLMFQPCPPAGSMSAAQVASIERMVSPTVKRNIAAIAATDLDVLMADASKAIPFLGMLLGFAYIGHAVWVFEGHQSALAAGCRNADVLIVDGGMVPHLQSDWQVVAASAMRRREIYVHDRAGYALRKVSHSQDKPAELRATVWGTQRCRMESRTIIRSPTFSITSTPSSRRPSMP